MRRIFPYLLALLFFVAVVPAYSEDMRIMMIEAQKKKEELLKRARQEKERAIQEAEETRKAIIKDKNALLSAIRALKEKNKSLISQRDRLKKELNELLKKERELKKEKEIKEADIQELVAGIRSRAKDLKRLLDNSLQSSFVFKERQKELRPIMNRLEFPGIDDIKRMVDIIFQEIMLSGQVRIIKNGLFIDRAGKEKRGEILVIGNFEAAYRIPGETGFLIYSGPSHRLFALSRLPPRSMTKKLNAYMDGNSNDVPIDISKGAALRQITYRLSLMEEIPKGGPIVIPILLIGLVAFVLIIERAISLYLKERGTEPALNRLMLYLSKGEWKSCQEICNAERDKPMFRVIGAGIKAKDMTREELEDRLQEAILNEIPALERFLSTIIILAEISPLLGLLGTVTGIINTFHVITLYGTGDPRIMSSGISEALVTTMLGLMVAIPVMFFHTLLSTKVENMISRMEKAAISFVNLLNKAPNKA